MHPKEEEEKPRVINNAGDDVYDIASGDCRLREMSSNYFNESPTSSSSS
jgi:hypothetical protein